MSVYDTNWHFLLSPYGTKRFSFEFAMDNGDNAYPNPFAGKPIAEHFQTSTSYYSGSANECTGNNGVNPIDFSQYLPDYSSDGTGPWVVSEISVPNWLHQYILGVRGNVAEELSKQLVHIRITFANGNKMVIAGPFKQVSIAKEFFRNYTAIMNSTVTVDDVPVNHKVHAQIIGMYSARVDKIQKETFTSIYFPDHVRRTGVALPPNVIRVQGYPPGLAAAKEAILQIAAQVEGSPSDTVQDGPGRSWHNVLTIGRNKELHEQSGGVQANFPKPGGPSCDAALRGHGQKDEKCAASATKISDDLEDETCREMYPVDNKRILKHLVGRGGATVEKIQNQTNTIIHHVQIPDGPTVNEAFVFFGKRKDVNEARQRIIELERKIKIVMDRVSEPLKPTDTIDDLQARQVEIKRSSYQETIYVDHNLLPRIIGTRCLTIANLAEKHDVHIEIPRPCSDNRQWESVTIFGSESKVKAAKDDLQELIRKKEAYTIESVYIDPTAYGRLIGPKGKNISEIEVQFDVIVKFPKPVGELGLVTICGRKDDIIKAKCRLLFLENMCLQADASKCRTFSKDSSGFVHFTDPPNPSWALRYRLPIASIVGGATGNTRTRMSA